VKRSVLLAVAVSALVGAPGASALIEPGNIGALPGNPYPTQPGVAVQGRLFTNQPLGPGGTPQDYLKFTVMSAGETIEFTDQNKTTGVNPATCDAWCPVFLSLVNSSFKGLGAGSGTIATYADTESFDWTFSAPGTYYMVMESDGDVNVSYAESYRIVSGVIGGCKHSCVPTTPPVVRTLHVSPKQTGTRVNAYITLGQSARSVRMALLYGKHLRSIASLTRAPLRPGRHHLKLRLPARYQHKLNAQHRLQLVVRITVRANSGASKTYNRKVTLTP
jgi:hypothetical protein